MNNVFDMIVNYLQNNQELKDSINSFHFLELSNDASYPAILMKNQAQNYHMSIYEKLSNIEMIVNLTLLDDSYDEIQFLDLYNNLGDFLKAFVLRDKKIEIIGNCKYTSKVKKDDIFQGNFKINVRIFFVQANI